MSLAVALIVLLAAFVALAGVVGSRINIRLAHWLSNTLESVFKPVEKRYTNIGGVVGYHFQYDTGVPLGKIDGTMTFLPRHTLLYLPFSLLAGRQDRLSITLHLDTSPPGRGHIVDSHQHRHGWLHIEDDEEMNHTPVRKGGRDFSILWYNPLVRDRLAGALDRIPDASHLRHFGYNGAQRTYFLELQPHRDALRPTLEYLVTFISRFAREPL